jgi:hypothetical protein
VKSGTPSRGQDGRWYLGSNALPKSPFDQGETSKHVLVDKLRDLPDWPPDLDPIAGHAVAFPDVELASLEEAPLRQYDPLERGHRRSRALEGAAARGRA